MRGLSTALVVGVIIALIVGFAAGYVLKPSGTASTVTLTVTRTVTAPSTGTGLPSVIEVGALLPLTGRLATVGEDIRIALEIAQDDINAFLRQAGLPVTFKITFEDTQTLPDVALQKLQAMHARGVQLFIGPASSAEVRNVKTYADGNKLVIVSPSSTAPELAIPGDMVFRFVTDDRAQGRVIAGLAKQLGLTHIVIVWAGDAWGDGLHDALASSAKAFGINVVDGPRYAPETKDFSSEVLQLNNIVTNLINQVGASKVGVVLISFEEGTQFLIQASRYENLGKVVWLGTDGIANAASVVQDPVASSFASKVKLFSPIMAPTESTKFNEVKSKVVAKLGREPIPYAYNAYDIAWVLFLSVLATGKTDGASVAKILPSVADSFFGASGWTKLNEAGDRAFADYVVYKVVTEEGTAKWVAVGIYSMATDSFTGSLS
jgi:branched-chain amino acid transport system substrate-binding protein